jgi:hypothetical protein
MEATMCEFSKNTVRTRPARQGEVLVTHHWHSGWVGVAPVNELDIAACLPPGCEVAFAEPIRWAHGGVVKREHTLARVFHDTTERELHHRDKLLLVDGQTILLNALDVGQRLVVLQLPPEMTPAVSVEAVSA